MNAVQTLKNLWMLPAEWRGPVLIHRLRLESGVFAPIGKWCQRFDLVKHSGVFPLPASSC